MKAKAETDGELEQAYFRGKQKTLHGVCVYPELTAWVGAHHRRVEEVLGERGCRFLVFDIDRHGGRER